MPMNQNPSGNLANELKFVCLFQFSTVSRDSSSLIGHHNLTAEYVLHGQQNERVNYFIEFSVVQLVQE